MTDITLFKLSDKFYNKLADVAVFYATVYDKEGEIEEPLCSETIEIQDEYPDIVLKIDVAYEVTTTDGHTGGEMPGREFGDIYEDYEYSELVDTISNNFDFDKFRQNVEECMTEYDGDLVLTDCFFDFTYNDYLICRFIKNN